MRRTLEQLENIGAAIPHGRSQLPVREVLPTPSPLGQGLDCDPEEGGNLCRPQVFFHGHVPLSMSSGATDMVVRKGSAKPKSVSKEPIVRTGQVIVLIQ